MPGRKKRMRDDQRTRAAQKSLKQSILQWWARGSAPEPTALPIIQPDTTVAMEPLTEQEMDMLQGLNIGPGAVVQIDPNVPPGMAYTIDPRYAPMYQQLAAQQAGTVPDWQNLYGTVTVTVNPSIDYEKLAEELQAKQLAQMEAYRRAHVHTFTLVATELDDGPIRLTKLCSAYLGMEPCGHVEWVRVIPAEDERPRPQGGRWIEDPE